MHAVERGPQAIVLDGVEQAGRELGEVEVGAQDVEQQQLPVLADRERGAELAGPLLAGLGGLYLSDNDVSPLDPEPRPMDFDHPPADVALARDRPAVGATSVGAE
ncbi:hypothetical protein OJ962_26735 [Solirubrobacter sp. CPCC 204708]|uniref:Uncharacterized protein n=1 Tax=Solirubrobacter deserti TaxID=2282478 RepID=A0ABT4RRB8_9ACTN|nr:hypothetical protein [Solirubrobacter deserti]MDA0141123.1 hypothetical protein [Solirubrobacter deserti]